ncbi:MAG: malate dehydrogenase, partial [Calditrichaeota bacterium]|nr:malate dehydrogenase [Calditrichota bacterium]
MKITVIGSGFVGSTTAQRIAEKELAKEVWLLDINEGSAKGKALDMYESAPVEGFDAAVYGTSDYNDTKNSDMVIMTAGLPRKPGMSRDDLLKTNADIMKACMDEVKRTSPKAIVIVVSNPLDAMVWLAKRLLGFESKRVIGMAGVLDSARYRTFIAMETGCSVEDVHAFVLGGHGDTMVPVPQYSTIAGVPISQFMSQDRIDAIVERTKGGGGEIVAHLKTGSAYYATSAAVVEMVRAIVMDKKKILPCAVELQGEYGIKDLYVGVPAVLGKNGIEKVVEVELNDTNKADLAKSVD